MLGATRDFFYICGNPVSMTKFRRTTAINKLLGLKKRKKVIQGGTWAGKTFGIIPVMINKAAAIPNREMTVVAETVPAVKKGAMSDFIKIMHLTGRWNEDRWHATDRKYTFANGSYIEFQAFDTTGKAKQAGKRTDLFINEAQYISFEIADLLMDRTSEDIWIDFNPTLEFWAHTEVLTGKDAEFLLLKYTDNEALPATILYSLQQKLNKAYFDPYGDRKCQSNIKSNYWANWCKVYIDGEIGSLEGAIFDNWSIMDNLPKNAQLLGAGMDFGFTNDPTTLIVAYRYNNKLIFDEVIYETGLHNRDIARLVKSNDYKGWIWADKAEPKTIDDLARNYKLKIEGADKPQGSVNFGISVLQEEEFFVTARSVNLIKELRAYAWKKTKDGKTTNDPIDAFNHGIDAMRYFAIMGLKKKKKSIRIKTRRRKKV